MANDDPVIDPVSSRQRSRRWLWIALILIAGGLLAIVFRSQPSSPATGRELDGPYPARPATQPTLRVALLNMHAGDDSTDPAGLSDIAKALNGYDVIGLNEVLGRRPWRNHRQAQVLGDRLQMPYLFAPAEEEWGCDYFGNALLCRFPVGEWTRTPLPKTSRRQPKSVLLAKVAVGSTVVAIYVTHLDHAKDQGNQLAEVAARFLSSPGPAILLGDLNLQSSDGPLRELLQTPGVVDAAGSILRDRAPADRVDWILCKGLRVIDGGMVDTGASDHPLVWAELSIETN